jgi:hypothetical protein
MLAGVLINKKEIHCALKYSNKNASISWRFLYVDHRGGDLNSDFSPQGQSGIT